MTCEVSDPGSCVAGVFGGVGKTLAGDAFDGIARSFASAAEDATKWLWATMGQASAVHFGGPGWARTMGITVSLALVIGVGLFLIQVTKSGIRQDLAGLGRALRGLLIAWGAGGAAITITEVLLAAADRLATGIMTVGAGTSNWQTFGNKVLAGSAIASLADGTGAVILLISLIVAAASVIVWAALMVRKLLLIISAVFAPVAFSGAQADVTASWVRRWIEVTLALIASKIVLVVIFVVGLGVLDSGVGQAHLHGTAPGHLAQAGTQVVTGALILCLAGFAPWLALKLVHFAGESFHTVHAHTQVAAQAGRTATQMPQKFRSVMPAVRSMNGSNRNADPQTANQARTGQSKPTEGARPTPTATEPSPSGPTSTGATRGEAQGVVSVAEKTAKQLAPQTSPSEHGPQRLPSNPSTPNTTTAPRPPEKGV